jgi:iron(III) transport system ATP-binding protein
MFLELDGISVCYPSGAAAKPAVNGVSLRMAAGQIGVLIGPSGCGKTSLLRAVAGLEVLCAGRVAVGGQTLSQALGQTLNQPLNQAAAEIHLTTRALHVPPEARRIGMVFQDYALFPHLTVADNISYGLHYLPRGERTDRVQQMLELVGLLDMGGQAPHQLSGGQQQRIALARALAPAPQLLLLDEPFSSLDVDLRERLVQDVRRILKTHGATALVVTHDQMEAFALGDEIGVMNQGKLEQWASAYTLYHRPASRFVAQFIGHGVFMPARIVTNQQGTQVHTALGALNDATECVLPNAYENGQCDVLLRADDIVHDDDSAVKACIERKAFRGSEFLYTLRLQTGEKVLAHVPSHHDHQIGEWIGIRPAVDHVVTFASAVFQN